MIVAIIVILLIFSLMNDWADEQDLEYTEKCAELRHRELMDAVERREENKASKVRRRRLAKDRYGNVIAEEIEVERGC